MVSVAVDLLDDTGLLASLVHKYDVLYTEGALKLTGRERVRLYRLWKNQCESRRLSPVLRQLDGFDHVLQMSPGSMDLYTLLEPLKRTMNLEKQCSSDMVKRWQQTLGQITQVRFRFFAKSSDKLNWFTVEYGIGGEFEVGVM